MFSNYIKLAWRNLWRNKVFSFINIFGLALGLASTIIILLSVADELSIDQFHAKKDRLFKLYNRAMWTGKIECWATTTSLDAPEMMQKVPEIKDAIRMTWGRPRLVSYKEKALQIEGQESDPAFLTMFSFPMLKGDPNTALNDVNDIVITESFAKKIFGTEDPMGKVVKIENKDNFIVTGVMKDLPENTSFYFEYLLPWKYVVANHQECPYWGCNSFQTYVELKPGADVAIVNGKIKNMVKSNSDDPASPELFLHPITKWHLYSKFENGVVAGGRIEYVRLVTIIALFILLIACINFMNLSTARSEKRAREVGIRKVVGAGRYDLVLQFLSESILITAIAFVFALLLANLLLPLFNDLVGKKMVIDYSQPGYWLAAILITLVTGLIAGSYPAFYLSSFQPVKVLKRQLGATRGTVTPRKVLVVFQFAISISLIICTIIIEQQLRHAQERPSGYSREDLVFSKMTHDIYANYDNIKNELLASGAALNVCKTSSPITSNGSNSWGLTWGGKQNTNNIVFDMIWAGDGFADPLKIPLLAGRDLNIAQFPSDTSACLINETSMKIMEFKDPIGQIIEKDSVFYHVVGVFKDFIWGSPYAVTEPMVIMGDPNESFINVRLNKNHPMTDNLKSMERIFKKYNPAYPFVYKFADEAYAQKFKAEQVTGKLATVSSLLVIIISCLGLFGLAAFTAEQRTKEIGVRRVLGASVLGLTVLLSKDFLKLVGIAALVAFPISWWAMHSWLQTYNYRISINLWVFLLSGIVAVIIALITVSFQTISAAMANPVKSLRSE